MQTSYEDVGVYPPKLQLLSMRVLSNNSTLTYLGLVCPVLSHPTHRYPLHRNNILFFRPSFVRADAAGHEPQYQL